MSLDKRKETTTSHSQDTELCQSHLKTSQELEESVENRRQRTESCSTSGILDVQENSTFAKESEGKTMVLKLINSSLADDAVKLEDPLLALEHALDTLEFETKHPRCH